MTGYVARRLMYSLPAVFLVALIIFSMVRIVPGDVIIGQMEESGYLGDEAVEAIRHKMGLDRPFVVQFATWLGDVVRGDLGKSLISDRSVRHELWNKFPVTLQLGVMSTVLGLLIAIPVGVISAIRQDTGVDYGGRIFAIAGVAVPDFWIATMCIVFGALWFGWIPPIGYVPITEDPVANMLQFILPALILGHHLSGTTMRMMRSTMLEVLRQDYVRTAWAKGLPERMVIYRHALKNAMIPVVTIIGTRLGRLVSGTVIIESIFALPGVGRYVLDAITSRDYPAIQASVMMLAVSMVLANLITDISYAWLDPRIRYQ